MIFVPIFENFGKYLYPIALLFLTFLVKFRKVKTFQKELYSIKFSKSPLAVYNLLTEKLFHNSFEHDLQNILKILLYSIQKKVRAIIIV